MRLLPAQAGSETVRRGAEWVRRLNPPNMPLYKEEGTALDLVAGLQQPAPRRVLCSMSDATDEGRQLGSAMETDAGDAVASHHGRVEPE